MQKKLMAVAVASAVGALVAPTAAVAQTSTVQIGGAYTVFYYSHSPNNPTAVFGANPAVQGTNKGSQRTDILESSEPELFIRGEEKLGGGLSAWFQCTSSLDGTITGANTARGLCGRNSAVGLKGNFGNFFFGNWDLPQKDVFSSGRGWWGGTNSFTGGSARLLSGGGASGVPNPLQTIGTSVVAPAATIAAAITVSPATAIANNPGEFYRRQASAFLYHSPVWNGFQVKASFSAANEVTSLPEANPLSPRLWSLSAGYSSGPLFVNVGYERHNDYNPSNVSAGVMGAGPGGCTAAASGTSCYGGGSDDNWTLVAGYTFAGVFSLRGMYSRSEYETNSLGQTLRARGWGLWGDWRIQGPHTLRFQYAKVNDTSGTSEPNVAIYRGPTKVSCGPASTGSCATGTGARLWAVAYSYALSKRTELSGVYTRLKNDANAAFTYGKVDSTAGNTQKGYGLVMKHRF